MLKVNVTMNKALKNFINKGLHFHGTKILEEVENIAEDELKIIADNALLAMRNAITTQSKNPEGRLERALTVEYRRGKNTVSFGIGDTDKLTREAPYWYVLNYGKTTSGKDFIPTGFIGYVNDGPPIAGAENKTGTLWEPSVTEGYLIIPKEFTPVRYITVGVDTIKQGMRNLNNKIREGMRTSKYLSRMSSLNPEA
jgi:hypothetical protein